MFPLNVWQQGTLQPSTPVNEALLRIEVLERAATSILSAPPGSPAQRQIHIVGASPTGAWSAFAQNDVVILVDATWHRFAPFSGWLKRVGTDVRVFDGSAWVVVSGGGGGGPSWPAARVYHVGKDAGMFATIQAAIDAMLATSVPTINDRAVIQIWPGRYDMTARVTVPSWTGIKGVSKGLVQLYNNTTDMFRCSSNVWFEDFLIEGAPTATLWAFDCNNANAVHIRRVDMLNNGGAARQKFLTQVGATWIVMFIEDCIIDYRATSDYAVLLQNTSGAARFCDVNINDVFFDAYGLTAFGGSFLVRACQDVRFKRSTIRGAATWNTGIRLERTGATGTPSIEVKHCDMANVANTPGGVSIFNEAGTTVFLTNSDCPASSFAGTVVNRNSNVA